MFLKLSLICTELAQYRLIFFSPKNKTHRMCTTQSITQVAAYLQYAWAIVLFAEYITDNTDLHTALSTD